MARAYRKDLWQGQADHVEILVEKDALAGVIEPATEEYNVCLTTLRGNCSETMIYRIAEIFKEIKKTIYCYYLGDHDNQGLKIEPDFLRRLLGFLGPEHAARVHWERLAVTEADFRKTKPDGSFEYLDFELKKNEKAKGAWTPYLNQYGDRCVEVDAIPSQELRDRVEAAILGHIDADEWDSLAAQEKEEAKSMREKFGLETDEKDAAEPETTDEVDPKADSMPAIDENPSPPSNVIRDPALLAKLTAKIRRAFRKAGRADADEDEQAMFCGNLVHLGVPIDHRSSDRIARVIQGEHPPEWLLT
jgi:hypothetical protein